VCCRRAQVYLCIVLRSAATTSSQVVGCQGAVNIIFIIIIIIIIIYCVKLYRLYINNVLRFLGVPIPCMIKSERMTNKMHRNIYFFLFHVVAPTYLGNNYAIFREQLSSF
jgi:hypothetical protein